MGTVSASAMLGESEKGKVWVGRFGQTMKAIDCDRCSTFMHDFDPDGACEGERPMDDRRAGALSVIAERRHQGLTGKLAELEG